MRKRPAAAPAEEAPASQPAAPSIDRGRPLQTITRDVPLLEAFPVHTVELAKSSADLELAAPEIRAPATYLQSVITEMLERLRGHTVDLTRFCGQKGDEGHAPFGDIKLASACSGTDAPVTVWKELVRQLQEDWNSSVTFEHSLSAEMNPRKRHFLRHTREGMRALFGDVRELKGADAVDYLKGDSAKKSKHRTKVPDVNVLISGFPCKSVSSLNSQRAFNRSVVKDHAGNTGSAFGGLVDFLKEHGDGVRMVLFENVVGLAAPPNDETTGERLPPKMSNLAQCMTEMETLGYFGVVVKLDPRLYASPQSRPRLWMAFWDKRMLTEYGMSEETVYSIFTSVIDRLSNNYGKTKLADVLLPEEHPALARTLAQAIEKKKASADSDAKNFKWPGKHFDECSASGKKWWDAKPLPPQLRKTFPWLQVASERELDVLRMMNVQFPEQECRLVCTQLSLDRARAASTDESPCVVPRLRGWLTSKCRYLHPLESMRLQGIYLVGESEVAEAYDADFLQDLVGNAFHTGCCAAASIAMLFTIATGYVNLTASPAPSTVEVNESSAVDILDSVMMPLCKQQKTDGG